jgi:uncharacterized protein with GYD domain
MRVQSLLIALATTTILALPATAQQSTTMHPYAILFKYTNQAVKALTESPQDRGAAARKLAESFGAKPALTYFFTTNSEYDGISIAEVPNETAQEAMILVLRSTGNFAKVESIPLMSAEEFKAAMEKARGTTTTYTPPTATRQ